MKVREAKVSDATAIAFVHVESWKTTYKNILPTEFLKNLSYKRREQFWETSIPEGNVFVAENDEGKIVGFASGGRERSGEYEGYKGELTSIYILKEYQGIGLGKQLMKSIVKGIEKLGINTMLVLVLEDNNSKLFYEAMGSKKIGIVEIEIAGKKLNELIYGWNSINNIFD